MSTRHRIELALIILAVVLLTGTAGFHFVEHWSWFDGFYMTLTTMTLLRSGETHPLTHAGRIFDSFLIVCTVTAVGFAIATISQALLEFEFGKAIAVAAWNANSPRFPAITSSAGRAASDAPSPASCTPAVRQL